MERGLLMGGSGRGWDGWREGSFGVGVCRIGGVVGGVGVGCVVVTRYLGLGGLDVLSELGVLVVVGVGMLGLM